RDVRPLQTSYKGRGEQSGPLSCGWTICRNNTPTRAGCTSPSSLTLSRGVSSAGPWVSAGWLTCQSERPVSPSGTVDPTQVSFITAIMDHSTPRLPLEKPYVKLGL